MSYHFKKSLLVGAALAVCGQASVAFADSAAQAGGDAAQQSGQIVDIVVTAQKRSESLSRVGMTVTAISGDTLRAQGIYNVTDLAKATPGLTFSESASNTPVYTLRGVGFYEQSIAAYPDVSVYVDEVPLPFPVMTAQAGLDPQRVEILKGPQGTLFGQNATGGAINFIAAKPTKTLDVGADLTYSSFNTIDASGYLSGPITDSVAGVIPAGGTLRQRRNVDAVNATGLEASAEAPLAPQLSLTVSGTLTRARVEGGSGAASLTGLRPAGTPDAAATASLVYRPAAAWRLLMEFRQEGRRVHARKVFAKSSARCSNSAPPVICVNSFSSVPD